MQRIATALVKTTTALVKTTTALVKTTTALVKTTTALVKTTTALVKTRQIPIIFSARRSLCCALERGITPSTFMHVADQLFVYRIARFRAVVFVRVDIFVC
jgi:hypothetical protein